jgi:hypothetical protein
MLMVSALAGASAFLTFAAAPQAECSAQPTIVPVSTTPAPRDAPNADGQLPGVGPKSRDPAVLLPDCKEAPRKKRKRRLSDYPMA